MGSREGVGVMRKLKCHMGWVFGGILEMDGGVSRTWSPTMSPLFLAGCLEWRSYS